MEKHSTMAWCNTSRGSLSRLALLLLVLGVRNADAFSSIHTSRGILPTNTRKATYPKPLPSVSFRRSHHNTLQQLRVLQQKEEQYVKGAVINGGDMDAALSSQSASQNELYKSAVQRTLLWITAAGLFGAGLFVFVDPQTSEEFFAGYLLEQSLSVDNLLVFLLLFEYFQVPNKECENRVLNWGIIGAIGMRAIMIGAGAVAIQQFHAVLLVFAAILLYSSAKVLLGGEDDEEEDLSENMVVQFSQKLIKSTDQFDGDRFFTLVDGVRTATPLFLCMVAVEISDVVFAVDSIPAVFGVTEVSSSLSIICSCICYCLFAIEEMNHFLTIPACDSSIQESPSCFFVQYVCYHGIAKFIYNSFEGCI